jgi:FkbM family methyltransferase
MHIDLIEKHSFIADHLSADSRVIDLGANEGNFSMEIIRRYGCYVVGVEPVPLLVERMPRHIRFTVEPSAINDVEHPIALNINPTMCSSIGLVEEGATSVTVPGITLSRLMEKHGIERAALLKVDIEGAEISLFESVPDSGLLCIDQITVEYHDFLQPQLREAVHRADSRLRRLGFQRLKFSLDRTDVLYLHPRLHLGLMQKAIILARFKYGRGARRRVRALIRP